MACELLALAPWNLGVSKAVFVCLINRANRAINYLADEGASCVRVTLALDGHGSLG